MASRKLLAAAASFNRNLPTDRQAQLLACVVQLGARSGRPPTIRELAEACGIRSTNGVHSQLKALRRKGLLSWQPRLRGSLHAYPGIPLMGDVT